MSTDRETLMCSRIRYQNVPISMLEGYKEFISLASVQEAHRLKDINFNMYYESLVYII
jgi:hypothetical protein